MVRLITHNLLACHVKNCTSNNFPLHFITTPPPVVVTKPAEFNADFLRGFLPKLEWKALVDTAKQLGDDSLPLDPPAPEMEVEVVDEEFLRVLHRVLLEIHVEEGVMVCPNCQHNYPIMNGIPNMLLAEHEVG